MRALTETETQTLFKKLADYTGSSLKQLIVPSDGATERHVFRVQNSRVYYVRESIANLAVSVARDNLLSLGAYSFIVISVLEASWANHVLIGTCIGKFTKTGT